MEDQNSKLLYLRSPVTIGPAHTPLLKMLRNIKDILSIFQISVNPDTILTNNNHLKEKSDNITDIWVISSTNGMTCMSLLKFV